MQNYEIGNRIYELRKAKGLSQKELGALIGVSNKAVSKWETGAAAPKTETIIKLAAALGISTEELLCSKNSQLENRSAFEALSDKTANMLLKKELNRYEKESGLRKRKSAKVYLICTAVLFVTVSVLFTALAFFGEAVLPFYDIDVEQGLTLREIILPSMGMAYVVCGIFTGIMLFVQILKKCPVWVIVLMFLFFYITFFVIEFGGLVMVPAQIIKSIRILKNKGEKTDG